MKINSVLLLVALAFTSNSFAGDYPKTRQDREIEEMGSLVGSDGITFRPGITRSESTKEVIGGVNKYLYKAAIEVLSFAPLMSADSNGGVIVTEWYTPKDQKNSKFKLNVFIRDQVISSESLDVVTYKKGRKNGKWSEDYTKAPGFSAIVKDKILRKARDLYLQSKGK